MFYDIEREIIKPTEAPDSNGKQDADFRVGMLEEDQGGGRSANHEKENALELYPAWVGDFFHLAFTFRQGSSADFQGQSAFGGLLSIIELLKASGRKGGVPFFL